MSSYIHRYFKMGQAAYVDGDPINPFMPHTDPFQSWEAGYLDKWFNEVFNQKEENNEQ